MSAKNEPCAWKKCDYARTQQCEMGYALLRDCENRAQTDVAEGAESAPSSGQDAEQMLVRWSGRALGTVDLLSAAARGPVTVIGVVGPSDSGKTTFLLAIYLLLLHGQRLGSYRFAGSWTLDAWESLASHARHTADHQPGFPPHTSTVGRVPGLLHLALRDSRGHLRDIVWTDAPGEWFMEWAAVEGATGAEGARWVDRAADAFLVFADYERFAGDDRGRAERELKDLIHTMARTHRGRPVNLLWTKNDMLAAMSAEDRARVDLYRRRLDAWAASYLPASRSEAVSVFDEAGQRAVLSLSADLLDRVLAVQPSGFELPVVRGRDPFLTYRGSP